jgi:hypothetical protein
VLFTPYPNLNAPKLRFGRFTVVVPLKCNGSCIQDEGLYTLADFAVIEAPGYMSLKLEDGGMLGAMLVELSVDGVLLGRVAIRRRSGC